MTKQKSLYLGYAYEEKKTCFTDTAEDKQALKWKKNMWKINTGLHK